MKKLLVFLCAISLLFLCTGKAGAVLLLSEDFSSGIPATWTVVDNAGNGVVWTNISGSGIPGNYTGGSGDAATVLSSSFPYVDFDTELLTQPFDLTGFASAELNFSANYQNYGFFDYFEVLLLGPGALSQVVLQWNEDHGVLGNTPGQDVSVDLSPYLTGGGLYVIGFRYYDPTEWDYDWYAQIDDVSVTGEPIPEPATMLLLSSGLVGLAGLRRKFRKN